MQIELRTQHVATVVGNCSVTFRGEHGWPPPPNKKKTVSFRAGVFQQVMIHPSHLVGSLGAEKRHLLGPFGPCKAKTFQFWRGFSFLAHHESSPRRTQRLVQKIQPLMKSLLL